MSLAAVLFALCLTPAEPKALTPISPIDLLVALRTSHEAGWGKPPSPRRLALAWAHVAIENGRGRWVWNHNLGNIGAPPSMCAPHYWHSPRTTYRSFATFAEGATAYWTTVRRCSSALAAFDDGRTVDAASSLQRCGYYHSGVDEYAAALTALYPTGLRLQESAQ